MLKWKLLSNFQSNNNEIINKIINILLENRSINIPEDREQFLNPKLEDVTAKSVGIDMTQLEKAIKRIKKAIENKEQIVVFGDYDVDGITGTAILWETLYSLKAKVMPYIPHRVDEGYGLSIKGIKNVILNLSRHSGKPAAAGASRIPLENDRDSGQVLRQRAQDSRAARMTNDNKVKLIITVDNGIVANEAVEFANTQGIDVIITDHHTTGEKIPNAHAIVHTTKLCGASIAWLFACNYTQTTSSFLDLVALATVADLVPLTGANRTLLKTGLPYLKKTTRLGLLALFEEAQIDPQDIGVYEVGHIIAPRLNAMGRLESAMDSLRLLCTSNLQRAKNLANLLGSTNRDRQLLTQAAALHSVEKIKNKKTKKILFLAENYEEGIIGLVAGKLVDTFYRPSIVLSKGEKISKASARSVKGFNIIEFIRSSSHLLINAGGHPMAAGFTVETEKILLLKEFLETKAETLITEDHLTRTINIDCELPLNAINQSLYDAIQKLSPFGMGNPEPIFLSKEVVVVDIRLIGKEKNHVKMKIQCFPHQGKNIECIGFNLAEKVDGLKPGNKIDIVYTIYENAWNGRKTLQLKIKDIKWNSE